MQCVVYVAASAYAWGNGWCRGESGVAMQCVAYVAAS